MIYNGYTIFANVDINEQWDIEEDVEANGKTFVTLSSYRDSGEADRDNISDYVIEDEEGDTPDWAEDYYDSLEEAKAAIDKNSATAA